MNPSDTTNELLQQLITQNNQIIQQNATLVAGQEELHIVLMNCLGLLQQLVTGLTPFTGGNNQ